jgi:hypothetical protein
MDQKTTAAGSRSVLKAFSVFVGALLLAGFAWAHGGWYAIFSFLFFVPAYFLVAAVLCGIQQYLMHKHPSFVPADRIRIPFVVIAVTLALQNLITPVLTDNKSSTGYWSLLSGFRRAAESLVTYKLAAGFYLLSNLVIMTGFFVFLVFVISDIRRANRQG